MRQRPIGPAAAAPDSLSFAGGRIQVDLCARRLFVEGQCAAIGSRGFDLLAMLLRHPDRLHTKAELLRTVWPGVVVEENNLHAQVTALRKVLGAAAVVNVHGRGYAWALKPDTAAAQSLFGREALLAAAQALLAAPSTRLLALHGPGGVGKTRLARTLLERLTPPRDGAYFVTLAPLTPAADLAETVARAFGLRAIDNAPPLSLLRTYLAERQVLLVLDNIEHLPDVPPLLTQLLAAGPSLKLVVTSRTRTKLEQEVTLEVPPLALPLAGAPPAAPHAAALRLFMQRAAEVGQPIAEHAREMQAAADICRQLDGLPLALELAAARLRLMTAAALREQIESSLRVVGAGSDATPDRQRSLHDTLQWSVRLLSPGAQRLLCRLGAFRGGFELRAALAVAADAGGADDAATSLDRLTELLDIHLVQRHDGTDGRVRYTMLETIRQFAAEALRSSGEEPAVAGRHATWYTQFALQQDRALRGRQRKAALAALDDEQANLRLALDHLVRQRRDAPAALRLVAALSWAWYFAGTMREGCRWQDQALALPIATDAPDGPDAADAGVAAADSTARRSRAAVFSGACKLRFYLGDSDAAVAAGERAVELARACGDRETLAYALFHLAIPMRRRSAAASIALHDEARALFGELHDDWGQALATCYGGIPLAFDARQQAAALQRLHAGRALFEQLEDDWGCTAADQYLSVMALRRGDLAEAESRARDVYRTAQELDDGFRLANALHQLGRIAIAAGRHADAEAMLLRAVEVNAEQGRYGYAGKLLLQCARLLARRGEHRLAAQLFGAASVDRGPMLIPIVLDEETQAADDAHDSLRERMGSSAFDDGFARGRAWSLMQAIDRTRSACAGGPAR